MFELSMTGDAVTLWTSLRVTSPDLYVAAASAYRAELRTRSGALLLDSRAELLESARGHLIGILCEMIDADDMAYAAYCAGRDLAQARLTRRLPR